MPDSVNNIVATYSNTIDFLERLRPGGPWVLTAIVPDGATTTVTLSDADAVRQFIRVHDGQQNLYFSVNPTRRAMSKKAAKIDIATIEYLHVDLDPKHNETPENAKARYQAALDAYPLTPAEIIDSGNGIQALWRLPTPINLPPPEAIKGKKVLSPQANAIIADVEGRTKLLMETLGSAVGTQNIDRILRLPGTTNLPNAKKIKDGRVACPTRLIRSNGASHPFENFPKPTVNTPQPQNRSPVDDTTQLDVFELASLPDDISSLIRNGLPKGEGNDRSAQFHRVVRWLKDRGWTEDEIFKLFEEHPRGIRAKYKLDWRDEVRRSFGKPDSPREQSDDPVLSAMNERHAAVSVKGKFRVLTWLPDPMFPLQQFAEFSAKTDFCNINEHPKVKFKVTEEGGSIKTVKMGSGAYFLSQPGHHRYDGIDFNPGAPRIIKRTDRNDRVTQYANMFSGFSVEPEEGDCSLYLAHIHDNIAGGNELIYNYSLNWMASGVQHPADPGRTAISLRGDPGAGKGVAVTEYGKIFGRHFLHLTNSEQLTGKFNASSAQSLLVFADEAMFAGDRKAAQILKTLISERTKMLELKGIDAFPIPNYARLIFSTNDEHPLRIEDKDRRYLPMYVVPHHVMDKPYFRAITDQMANGGRAALLDFLLKRDISNFNPEAIPDSDERFKQKLASAPAGDRVVISFTQDCCLPGALVDVDGQRKDRPWIARGRGPGFLFDEMRRRGGREMQYLDEVHLTDILKSWGFIRKPLGDQSGWAAPPLPELRMMLETKYPGLKWDFPEIIEWGAISAAEQTEKADADCFTEAGNNIHGIRGRRR